MFGFGKRKRTRDAEKLGSELADAIRLDIDEFAKTNVAPHRRRYLEIMRDNLVIEDDAGKPSAEVASAHLIEMLENWMSDALPMFRNGVADLCDNFEQNGLPEMAAACRQRLEADLNNQSYELACEGIEVIREAFAARAGDPPLNGAGMADVRNTVLGMGNPNLDIDWNKVLLR